MLEEELEVAKYAVELGLAAKEVSRLEIQQMEPDVNINAIGAAYFECDHHSTPQEFMTELKAYLTNAGVNIYANEKVLDIVLKNHVVESIVTSNRTFKPDEIVMATGSWSALLAKKLGVKLLLQAGKGYRINTNEWFYPICSDYGKCRNQS